MEYKYVKNKDWYIPDIQCSSNSKKENIGKYGRMRERFLKEHKHSLLPVLSLEGIQLPIRLVFCIRQ